MSYCRRDDFLLLFIEIFIFRNGIMLGYTQIYFYQNQTSLYQMIWD